MRNISCALTTQQVRDRTKTVTRRLGWKNVKKGDLLQIVVKGMGLKPGESPGKLAIIVVAAVHRVPLNSIRNRDVEREGFPGMHWHQFVAMFCDHMVCNPQDQVTRIEFRYIPGGRT